MHKLFNAILVVTVLVSGFVLYTLEHTTRSIERDLARLDRSMAADREYIRMLDAEWSSLTRPERLQALAREHLHLQTLAAPQIVSAGQLALKVPPEPIIKLEAQDKDPIGDILQKMQ